MKRNLVEWIVLGVSAIAILAVVGLLVTEGLATGAPPDPSVELHRDQARTTSLGWVVPATISNEGDDSADQVALEATATVDGKEEMSAFGVAFLPAGSEVEVEIGFSAEPDGAIDVRIVGYGVP